jgi:hypothetical protein
MPCYPFQEQDTVFALLSVIVLGKSLSVLIVWRYKLHRLNVTMITMERNEDID